MNTTMKRRAQPDAQGDGQTRGWRTDEVGLFDVNFDTGERYWSRELRHIVGIEEDAPADFALFLQRVHPADRRAVAAAAVEPFREDCPPQTRSEFRVVDDVGGVRWVHVERLTIYRPSASSDVMRVAGFMVEIPPPPPPPPKRERLELANWRTNRLALLLLGCLLICSACADDSLDDHSRGRSHHGGHRHGQYGGGDRSDNASPTPSPL